jgi:hypothetical protein
MLKGGGLACSGHDDSHVVCLSRLLSAMVNGSVGRVRPILLLSSPRPKEWRVGPPENVDCNGPIVPLARREQQLHLRRKRGRSWPWWVAPADGSLLPNGEHRRSCWNFLTGLGRRRGKKTKKHHHRAGSISMLLPNVLRTLLTMAGSISIDINSNDGPRPHLAHWNITTRTNTEAATVTTMAFLGRSSSSRREVWILPSSFVVVLHSTEKLLSIGMVGRSVVAA